ncbi:hypothetical protein MHH_c21200 [Mannheimia haemolytica M42548]|nr:hypothetical protein MHH_c21200 [Mannheimia haemolytica M42548]
MRNKKRLYESFSRYTGQCLGLILHLRRNRDFKCAGEAWDRRHGLGADRKK